jgi:hypothetical protein
MSLSLLLNAAPGQAQIFISATGDDENSCSRAAPCRTLQRGINATGAGREMTILTSGEYGRGTIIKSISILAEGVSANIRSFAAGTNAITIDNPAARVVLKGLFLTGGGAGESGVRIEAAAVVHIERCTIERFSQFGIGLNHSGDTNLLVKDSIVRDNGSTGLVVDGAGMRLMVDNSRFESNGGSGVIILDGAEATITRSVASGNSVTGIGQLGGRTSITWTTAAENGGSGYSATSGARMTLESSIARGNGASGLFVQNVSTARISNNVLTHNVTGISSNATVFTRQNNIVRDNIGSDLSGNPPQAFAGT